MIMVGQWTQRVVRVVGVLFTLALCLLIGGMGPPAAALRGNDSMPPQRLYGRQADGIWVSDDAGISWTQVGALPSRPLAIAAARGTPGLVFVGTESLGLLRSNDGGASWQRVDSTVLAGGYAAPLAVTALAIDSEDEQIVYAATNIWLGTNTAHLTPLGVAVSVDGGRQWLQLSRAQLGDTPLQRLEPVAGRPLAVVTANGTGSNRAILELSPGLLGLLQDGDPAVRASAARAIGLMGDSAALPGLMQALADPDALAGQRIAEAIGRIGDRSVSADLLNVLGSAPAAERARAARALGLLKSGKAVPGLAALLGAGDPEAQRVAAEALAAIGTPAAMAALTAPLADQQMTSARHAAMRGLEMAGQSAVTPLAAALQDGNAVVRANAAEMLGWLKPVEDPGQGADAVAGLARLLSDPDPAVQAQAAWALGEMGTGPAHLALIPAPIPAPNPAPILALMTARPVAPAPLAALPDALADVPADYWTLAVMSALVVLALLAVVLIWKGPRPTSHLGHA
jgi:HEAT repeat protein